MRDAIPSPDVRLFPWDQKTLGMREALDTIKMKELNYSSAAKIKVPTHYRGTRADLGQYVHSILPREVRASRGTVAQGVTPLTLLRVLKHQHVRAALLLFQLLKRGDSRDLLP